MMGREGLLMSSYLNVQISAVCLFYQIFLCFPLPPPFFFYTHFTIFVMPMFSSPCLYNLSCYLLPFSLPPVLISLLHLFFYFVFLPVLILHSLSLCRLVTLENSPAITPELLRIFQNMSALMGEHTPDFIVCLSLWNFVCPYLYFCVCFPSFVISQCFALFQDSGIMLLWCILDGLVSTRSNGWPVVLLVQRRDKENIPLQKSELGKKTAKSERTSQHHMIKYFQITEKLREWG